MHKPGLFEPQITDLLIVYPPVRACKVGPNKIEIALLIVTQKNMTHEEFRRNQRQSEIIGSKPMKRTLADVIL